MKSLLDLLSVSASRPPSSSSFGNLNEEIVEYSKAYDWYSATHAIEEFLTKTNGTKEAFELLGDCCYNLAFQHNTREEFRRVILRAKDAYEKTFDDPRCEARAGFCKYCASDSPDERREVINSECLPKARELVSSLDASKKDELISSRAYAEFLDYLLEACAISPERKQLLELIKEAKITGRNAFLRFKASSDPEIAIPVCNSYANFLSWASGQFINSTEQKQIEDELLPFIGTLSALIEKTGDPRLRSLGYEIEGIQAGDFKGDWTGASSLLGKALLEAEKTKDSYLLGEQSFLLGYSLVWASSSSDVAEVRKELGERAVQSLSRAIEYHSLAIAGDLPNSFEFLITSLSSLSRDSTNVSEKSQYLDRAIEIGRTAMQFLPFYPLSPGDSSLGNVLALKAELLSVKGERERLLSEAVNLIQNHLQRVEKLSEPDSWNLGAYYSNYGFSKAKLSDEKIGQE
ncbi:MAG: hypothetical protein ACRECH_15185, partial [Nitrososphaerales archaeon]